ncbi:MAG: exodeoxyribonuclease VII small subunit [Phycisphaerales bacterium]|nr:MAG: exodeoxyribonuclease VII small subunit [Phycisphaerales bacterium]
MAKKQSNNEETPTVPPAESLSFERAVEELESIIDRIEQGEIGLEESLRQRKRGDELIKRCRTILDAAEQELETAAEEKDSEQ